MASIQPRGNKYQLRVRHALLAKPFFWTFDTEPQARAYGEQLESMLAQGIVPAELHDKKPTSRITLTGVIDDYLDKAHPAASDRELLRVVAAEVCVKVSDVTYAWAADYVRTLKTTNNLAPGTIRKRVGSLARVLDWHHRATTGQDQVNPFRLLPRGYSGYTDNEAKAAPDGVKRDVKRDRRISHGEILGARAALAGTKRKDRERPWGNDPDFAALFDLILGTGLRLSEAYRSRPEQFDLEQGFMRVAGSKGHRGALKPRVVVLRESVVEVLRGQFARRGAQELLFPFWDGDPAGVKKAQSRLTARFRSLFDYAEVLDITEHDLRHSACCDWFELRNAQGQWAFSEVEIAKMMGWSSLDMVLRYASFRAGDLADRLRVKEAS